VPAALSFEDVSEADSRRQPEYGSPWPVADRDEQEELRFIQRLCDRDERAFNELVELYQERVFRLVFRMLGRRDEAEDLVQEVFVQVFKAIGTFRGDSKLATWIYRIAVNLCKNRVKYLWRRKADAQDEFEATQERHASEEALGVTTGEIAGPEQAVRGFQLELIIKECIAELEPDFSEVLVLRDIEGLSYEEITEITGLAEGTVKSRIHRARVTLKAKVERLFGEKVE
jgi:RNA polymerase sigma-70 factor, ECF subfamily